MAKIEIAETPRRVKVWTQNDWLLGSPRQEEIDAYDCGIAGLVVHPTCYPRQGLYEWSITHERSGWAVATEIPRAALETCLGVLNDASLDWTWGKKKTAESSAHRQAAERAKERLLTKC